MTDDGEKKGDRTIMVVSFFLCNTVLQVLPLERSVKKITTNLNFEDGLRNHHIPL